jgi:riboflavin synthase
MFTGIVQGQCPVVGVEDHDGIRALTVDLGEHAEGLRLGASVANNGVCLTVTGIAGTEVSFDVIDETVRLTNLRSVAVGSTVNIERSLRFGDELGGHILSGHISATARVEEIEVDGANRTMWFRADPALMPFMLLKGWVALDGASLTISRVDRDHGRFAVSLIPETLERTSLGRVGDGDEVNLEIDTQTRTIVETVRAVLRDSELRSQILDNA